MPYNIFKLYSAALALMLLTACDPACEGIMQINNDTEQPIEIMIEKKGFFESDTILYFMYQTHPNSTSQYFGDTLLVVKCWLNENQTLQIYYEGPIGTLDLSSKENGQYLLKELTDTIYLRNQVLSKNIYDMNNWNIKIDKYNNGGGESLFNFTISDTDIEKE